MFGCPKFKQSASHCLGPHWCPTAPCPSGARFPVAGGARPGLWHRRKAGWGPGLGKLPCASGTKSHCHFQFPTAWPECSTPETGSGNDSVALTTPQACKGGVTLLGWGLSPTHVFPGTHAGPPAGAVSPQRPPTPVLAPCGRSPASSAGHRQPDLHPKRRCSVGESVCMKHVILPTGPFLMWPSQRCC